MRFVEQFYQRLNTEDRSSSVRKLSVGEIVEVYVGASWFRYEDCLFTFWVLHEIGVFSVGRQLVCLMMGLGSSVLQVIALLLNCSTRTRSLV